MTTTVLSHVYVSTVDMVVGWSVDDDDGHFHCTVELSGADVSDR